MTISGVQLAGVGVSLVPPSGGGSGTVTDVSVVSANGFAGSVATSTTTPAITLSTTVTGTLYGNGTAMSASKLALTQPATGSTLTVADGKTLTANNSLTLAGTDSTTMTFPSTSATIARTDAGQTFTGANAFSTSVAVGGATIGSNALAVTGTSDFSSYVAAAGAFNRTSGNLTLNMGAGGGTVKATLDNASLFQIVTLGLGSATAANSLLTSDAANTLAQRNGTSSQTHNIYDTYTSATDYHRLAIKTNRATLSGVTGASVTATGIIPDGAVVMGVTTKVTTGLGTGSGTTGYQVGDGVDADRWGDVTGTAAGTSTDNTNWTATTIQAFTAASDIVITANGGNFDGTGVIYVSVQYLIGQAD